MTTHDHVESYRDGASIERLRSLIEQLPADRSVRLVLHDGTVLVGIVGERPVLQLFREEDGREGANARLRLERATPAQPDVRDLWIADIASVESPRPGET